MIMEKIMRAHPNGKHAFISTILVAVAFVVAAVAMPAYGAADPALAVMQNTDRGNPNPGVIPNVGPLYGELGAAWWLWAYSFPFAEIPFFNTGGPVDISAGQLGHVWFLAGANSGPTTRTGTVPAGTALFLPMANLINDYPCPPQFGFEPNPGESLEDFLQRTANDFFPALTDVFAEIDGRPLRQPTSYRAMSDLFLFKADPAAASFDPCVTGTRQPGVAVGYWLLLPPMTPGRHTLHFGSPSWNQDVRYELTVTHGH